MALNPKSDIEFQSLARVLSARRAKSRREPVPGTRDVTIAAVEDGLASLEMDPDLVGPRALAPWVDDEDDENDLYLRDYSRSAGPGVQ